MPYSLKKMWQISIQILDLLSICVTQGKLPDASELGLPHLACWLCSRELRWPGTMLGDWVTDMKPGWSWPPQWIREARGINREGHWSCKKEICMEESQGGNEQFCLVKGMIWAVRKGEEMLTRLKREKAQNRKERSPWEKKRPRTGSRRICGCDFT